MSEPDTPPFPTTLARRPVRLFLATAASLFCLGMPAAQAAAPGMPGAEDARTAARDGWIDAVFVQRGVGEEVQAFTIGVMRHVPVRWLGERTDLYGEASISQWQAGPHSPRDTGTLVQLALKPVLRWRVIEGRVPTFVELGIGLTVTSEIYRKSERQFSSAFNFGDHLAIGWNFGSRGQHEIALRVEHFSNGNIRLPNPGENFRELRYAIWF